MLYPGYSHRRTIGFDNKISTDGNVDIERGAVTYVFAFNYNTDEKDEDDMSD